MLCRDVYCSCTLHDLTLEGVQNDISSLLSKDTEKDMSDISDTQITLSLSLSQLSVAPVGGITMRTRREAWTTSSSMTVWTKRRKRYGSSPCCDVH